MSIRFLRTFVHIAKLGSFSKAASVLGMTQSTVSLQMKALENEMRVELFDRSKRRPTINARGRALLKKSIELLKLYDQLGGLVGGYDDLIGTLHIGSVNTIMTGILPEALFALRQQHSQLETRIISGLSGDLMRQVNNGDIDAALVSEPPFVLDENLHWSTICAEPLVIISAPSAGGDTDTKLLQRHPFIRFNRHTWAGKLIDQALRRRNIAVDDRMSLDSLEAISQMVSRGLGVSIVPQRPIRHPFPASLKVTPFGASPTWRNIGILTRSNSSCSMLTRALHSALADTAEKTVPAKLSQGKNKISL